MPSLGACCSAASNGDWGPPCEQNRAAPGAENVYESWGLNVGRSRTWVYMIEAGAALLLAK